MNKKNIFRKKEFSMKKTLRNFLAVLTAIVSLITSFAFVASAAEPVSGQCGDNVYWSFDTMNHTLTVSGEGAMWDFDTALVPENHPERTHDRYNTCASKLVFDGNITCIGEFSFYNFEKISEVVWTDSIEEIACGAFMHSGIEEVIIPDSVRYIGEDAFSCCERLKKVSLPKNLIVLEDAFKDDNALSDINIGKAEPTEYANGFTGVCRAIEHITADENNSVFKVTDNVLFDSDGTLLRYPTGNRNTVYTVPEGTKCIGSKAFSCTAHLKSVYFPISVKRIMTAAFVEPLFTCSVSDIYYAGTEKQWNDLGITREENSQIIDEITVHFNTDPAQMEIETAARIAEEEKNPHDQNDSDFNWNGSSDDSQEHNDDLYFTYYGNGFVASNIDMVYVSCGLTVRDVCEHFLGAEFSICDNDGQLIPENNIMNKNYILLFDDGASSNFVIVGDPDGDGEITAADARYALRLSVGLEADEPDSYFYQAADADMDGEVSAADARLILRTSVGLDAPRIWNFEK